MDGNLTSTIAIGLSASSTAVDFAKEKEKEGITFALGATSTTATAYTYNKYVLDPQEKEIKDIRRTANVINYLETYTAEQRNDLINQIDELLDKEENISLSLKKNI